MLILACFLFALGWGSLQKSHEAEVYSAKKVVWRKRGHTELDTDITVEADRKQID